MGISVVVTTYNGASWVVEQLESILRQTRQPDEVLIYDDCSTDNTFEIVSDFIKNNHLDNWKFVVNEVNKGWKENFKFGLLNAKEDLVFPCDQDDIWRSDKLEIMERVMNERENILVLTSNYEKFGDCQQKIVPNKNDKAITQIQFNGNLFKVFYPGCSYCIRKSFLKDIEKFWTPNSPHDATIWRYAIIKDGLFAINDNLILWRVYNTSTFEVELQKKRNKDDKRRWLDYAMGVLSDIQGYIDSSDDPSLKKLHKDILKNKKWLELRMRFYDRFNIIAGLRLMFYIKYYAAPIQYIGDWYHVIIK